MAVRPKIGTPLLRDPYGLWCGQCGDRIKDSTRHPGDICVYHHVDQQWLERDLRVLLLPSRLYSPVTVYDWDQFLVLVHRKCHGPLDAYSRLVAEQIAGAYSAPLEQVEGVATSCFGSGDYAIAARLRQCLRYRFAVEERDDEQQRQNFQFELVASAGLWFFSCISLSDFLAALPQELKPDPKQRSRYSLFLLNPLVTNGIAGSVDLVREFAASVPQRGADAVKAKAIRLDGIASLQHAITRVAEEMAETHAGPHQQVTSITSNVWALVNEHHDTQALDELGKIVDALDASSLWQFFQIQFARGCSTFVANRPKDLSYVLADLLRAQLVMVARGFRGWSIPDIRFEHRKRARSLYPEDILRFLIEKYGVSQRQIDEIRKTALPRRLFDKLWMPPMFLWRPKTKADTVTSAIARSRKARG